LSVVVVVLLMPPPQSPQPLPLPPLRAEAALEPWPRLYC